MNKQKAKAFISMSCKRSKEWNVLIDNDLSVFFFTRMLSDNPIKTIEPDAFMLYNGGSLNM